jgi:sodium-dependent dicarboxylate transporter 2/3/5
MTRNDISLGTLTIPGWGPSLGLEGLVDDGTVAIAMALVLFLLPSKRADSGKVLDWNTMSNMPWGIVLLLGGGFALAGGMTSSGLSSWVGNRFSAVGQLSPFTVVGFICLATTFLTELTSNTATSQMILPILASVAVQLRIHPLFLMIPSTISASCAFMLPVATPPNAIVFGSGRVRIIDMARAGLILNFLGVALVTALMYVLAVRLFGIDLGTMPDWAVLD